MPQPLDATIFIVEDRLVVTGLQHLVQIMYQLRGCGWGDLHRLAMHQLPGQHMLAINLPKPHDKGGSCLELSCQRVTVIMLEFIDPLSRDINALQNPPLICCSPGPSPHYRMIIPVDDDRIHLPLSFL